MIPYLICGYHLGVRSSSNLPILGLCLRCDRRAPGRVRRALEGVLRRAPVLDDARLVATELVNNAVLHSGCTTDDVIRVVARIDDEFLTISVHDPGTSAQVRKRYDSEPGGLGLRIVEQIAAHWGSETPNGHRVWAVLPVRP